MHNALFEEFQNLNSELYPLTKCSPNLAIPDVYTQNKKYGNHSSESIDSSLDSAGHLYRLNNQISKQKGGENPMESVQKNILNNYCVLDKKYQLNTNLEVNHSNIKNRTDCKILKQKSLKCVPENSSCNGKKCYTEKLSSFKNKNIGKKKV